MTKRRILWINPVGTDRFDIPIGDYLNRVKGSGTMVDVVSLDRGPTHLNFISYEALVVPEILKKACFAERDGYNAVIVGCFNDTGVSEARELTNKLYVIGPGEASHKLASVFGQRWCVLVSQEKCIPRMRNNAIRYGFGPERVIFRSLDIGVHEFQSDLGRTKEALSLAAHEAVRRDRVETIILGCTAQYGFYKELQKELGIPVLDVAIAALKYSEFLIEIGQVTSWYHSKALSYATPPLDELSNLDVTTADNGNEHKD